MRKTITNEDIFRIYQKTESKDLIRFSICGITYPDKSYKICRPASRIACIEYIEEGYGTVTTDGKTFIASAGDSYFLMTGKDQYYYSSEDEPWKKIFVNLSGRLLDSLVDGYGIRDTAYFKGLDISEELREIIKLSKIGNEDCTDDYVIIINRIFIKMRHHVKAQTELYDIAAVMKDYINTQLTTKFSLNALCAIINKSESQAIKLFKKAYGVTPYAYILQKRIDFSKKLLTDTNLTVKQIADRLCFSDEYYFSNLFKKKTGVSPSSFRKGGRL